MPLPQHVRPAPAWHGRPAERRRTLLIALAAATAFAVAIGVVVVALSTGGQPRPAQEAPGGLSTAVPRADPAPSATPIARSEPVGVVIRSIDVDAPLVPLTENSDGSMRLPPAANHELAGWYEGGPAPGQRGPAVLLGRAIEHGDKFVFNSIGTLTRGAAIDVSLADGHVAEFTVDGVQRVASDRFPTKAVYGPLSYPALRLVAPAGSDTVIVYAHLAS